MILLVSIFTGFGLPGLTFSNMGCPDIWLFVKSFGSYWMRLIMSLFWFRATGFEAIFSYLFKKKIQNQCCRGIFTLIIH